MSKEAKRYVLLKDLPNINTGTELEWKNQSYGCFDKNGFTATLNKMLVEQNPSWFKEILPESKEWEIVECYDSDINITHQYIEKEREANGCKIKSVKRLSDNEVFSVGDEIGWGVIGNYKTTIIGFIIKDGRLKIDYSDCPNHPVDFLEAMGLHKKSTKTQGKDVFTWDDALIEEFIMTENCGYSIEVLRRQISGFKQSKQPSIDTKEERIEVLTEDNEQWVKLPLADFEKYKYTEQDLEKTFNESRLTHPMIGFKYPTFQDYKNDETRSQNASQTTTSKHIP